MSQQSRRQAGRGDRRTSLVQQGACAVWLCLVLSLGCERAGTPTTQPATGPAGAATSRPALEAGAPVHEFGSVLTPATVRHVFILRNTGSSPVQVHSVEPDCGCTVAEEWEKAIPPGSEWKLPLKLEVTSEGPVAKHITVKTSDAGQPEVRFTFRGTAKARFQFAPPRPLLLRDLNKDSVAQSSVRITNQLDTPITLKNAKVDSSLVNVALREVQAGREYELQVATVPPLPLGITSAQVTIETDVPEEPTITVPVSITALPRLALTPASLTLPQVPTQETRRLLTLKNTGTSPVHITGIDLPDQRLRIDQKAVEEGRHYQLWLITPAGIEVPSSGWAVTVKTDDAELPRLQTQIRATSRPAR